MHYCTPTRLELVSFQDIYVISYVFTRVRDPTHCGSLFDTPRSQKSRSGGHYFILARLELCQANFMDSVSEPKVLPGTRPRVPSKRGCCTMNCCTLQKLVLRVSQGSQVAAYQYMSKIVIDRKPYFLRILS